MGLAQRLDDEGGAVLIVVAMVMVPLTVATAFSVGVFTLYGVQREMQKAADQAAVAGAAALPPLDPDVAFETLPFPIPDTDPVFEITGDRLLDLPRITDLVPDPRAVACAYGAESLSAESSNLVGAFGTDPTAPPATVCTDIRVYPSMQSSPAYSCIENIAEDLESRLLILETDPLLAPLVPDVLSAVMPPVEQAVAALGELVPAALKPTMRVEINSGVVPPLLSVAIGEDGLEMQTQATAQRRLKNAVVVPLIPGGEVGPVITDDVNLNTVLAEPQPALIDALGQVDGELNELNSQLNLTGCQDLLSGLRQDLGDIYNPPTGPAPSALDLIEASVTAAETAAIETGVAVTELAGEAYYAIGAGEPVGSIGSVVSDVVGPLLAPTALALLGPLTEAQIPTLDVAVVVFTDLGNEDYHATVVDAANARGLFQATLVAD